MRISKILTDRAFDKKFEKYKRKLTPKEREALKDTFKIFTNDAFDSRLGTHRLSWPLAEYFSFRINYGDRIKFKIVDNETVYLYDIGDHDAIYR